jgi:hypothetical protein
MRPMQEELHAVVRLALTVVEDAGALQNEEAEEEEAEEHRKSTARAPKRIPKHLFLQLSQLSGIPLLQKTHRLGIQESPLVKIAGVHLLSGLLHQLRLRLQR